MLVRTFFCAPGIGEHVALERRTGTRRQRRWAVGKGAERSLSGSCESAPAGACKRLRHPCAVPRGWREHGPALCGGRPQSPRLFSPQLQGPAPSSHRGSLELRVGGQRQVRSHSKADTPHTGVGVSYPQGRYSIFLPQFLKSKCRVSGLRS